MTDPQSPVTNTDVVKAFFNKHKNTILFGIDILLNLVIIAALVFLIRTFLISPFQVYGPSMCDTMNYINGKCEHGYGEYIIVNKFGYQNFLGWQVGLPKRGDIVVFHPPLNKDEFFIKRVIGLPGETIQLKGGYVYVFNDEHPEGVKLDEPYLNSTNNGSTHPFAENMSIFEVPDDEYFVMGDNRTASSDARSCFKESITSGGCSQAGNTPYLKLSNIEGKAWLVLWPLSKIELIKETGYKL
jgi:signal peptidase I